MLATAAVQSATRAPVACTQAVFAVWLWQHAVRLDAQPQPHRPAHNDPVLHFKRLVAHAKFFRDVCGRALDWRSYVSKWFKVRTRAYCM